MNKRKQTQKKSVFFYVFFQVICNCSLRWFPVSEQKGYLFKQTEKTAKESQRQVIQYRRTLQFNR